MNSSLPETWALVRIGNLVERVESRSPADSSSEDFHYIDISSVDNTTKSVRSPSFVPVVEAPSRARQVVLPGDILVSTVRPALNAVAMVPDDLTRPIASTGFCVLRAKPALLNPKYLFHFTISDFFVSRLVNYQKGGSYPAVTDGDVLAQMIPLPPLSEQQRIVDILQEAECIRRLRAQAVAKMAELIPALFQQVFLAGPSGLDRFEKRPLGELLSSIETGWSPVASDESASRGNWGVLKLGAVTWGTFRDGENKALLPNCEPKPELEVKEGDLLLVRKNTRELVGATAYVWQTREKLMFSDLIFRLSLRDGSVVSPKYLWALFSHPSFRPYVMALADGAAGSMPNIPKSRLEKLRIPVPSQELQHQFIAQLETATSVDPFTKHIAEISSRLESSLSAHAFSGQLTAEWREANEKKLAAEAHDRDEALSRSTDRRIVLVANAGANTKAFASHIFQERTDGIYSDLNREQRFLLREIKRMFAGVDYGRYFTAEKIADEIEGPLHRNPQGVLAHLQVFATRGLLIPVSRRRKDSAGSPFAGCYRLSLKASEKRTYSGVVDIELPERAGDDVKEELMKIQRGLATGSI